MTTEQIISGSKKIAEYMGWVYIPFNDLQGFPRAGWYQVEPRVPNIQKIEKVTIELVDGDWIETSREEGTLEVDINIFKYHKKNGWSYNEDYYFKYMYRNHSDLRFYNSLDSLLPVIEKLEREDLSAYHYQWKQGDEMRSNFESISFIIWTDGCSSETNLSLDPPMDIANNFNNELTCVQNAFNTVVETIEYVKTIKTRVDKDEDETTEEG